jgi:hypothetical protein
VSLACVVNIQSHKAGDTDSSLHCCGAKHHAPSVPLMLGRECERLISCSQAACVNEGACSAWACSEMGDLTSGNSCGCATAEMSGLYAFMRGLAATCTFKRSHVRERGSTQLPDYSRKRGQSPLVEQN